MVEVLNPEADRPEVYSSGTSVGTAEPSIEWRVASTVVSVVAETILIVVTLVIIAAMWLPAYLTSTGQHAANHDPMHNGRMGFAPNR